MFRRLAVFRFGCPPSACRWVLPCPPPRPPPLPRSPRRPWRGAGGAEGGSRQFSLPTVANVVSGYKRAGLSLCAASSLGAGPACPAWHPGGAPSARPGSREGTWAAEPFDVPPELALGQAPPAASHGLDGAYSLRPGEARAGELLSPGRRSAPCPFTVGGPSCELGGVRVPNTRAVHPAASSLKTRSCLTWNWVNSWKVVA